ncbi:MAG: N-acetylmuramoyl-L-alanine amidase family protein [Lachnospiraceae bacterium]|nr:N-acetylmuramoyl-L-alanine amidase family protein [Lachnospiraceae bacterium]
MHTEAATVISSASLTIKVPAALDTPDYEPVLPSGAKYYLGDYTDEYYYHDVVWVDITDGTERLLKVEDAYFERGHKYAATIYLTADSGYEFTSSTTCTINGAAASSCSVTDSGQLRVEIEFPVLKETIYNVDLTIKAPAALDTPDYEPVLPSGAKYYLGDYTDEHYYHDVVWVDITDGTERLLKVEDAYFERGHKYAATIYLTADSGYEFTASTTCTINGAAASSCSVTDSGQLRVEIEFPALKETGKWIKNAKGWWYRRADGSYPKDQWEKINGKWYHFDASGYMQTGWKKLGGLWYYLDSTGAMVTGWQTIGGKTYYFKKSGAMAAKEWCSGWWLNADGTWTYKYRASWKKNSTGWWYGDTSGWYAKNCTIKIDGKNYTFNANGYMK